MTLTPAQKAAKTRLRRAAEKKAAATRKRHLADKKGSKTRKLRSTGTKAAGHRSHPAEPRASTSLERRSGKAGLTPWRWQTDPVDPQSEHIELRYGPADTEDYEQWLPVALVGKPENYVFPVLWLVDLADGRRRKETAAVRKDLDFYLLELGERDPWGYARYHCNTAANMYSKVHWSHFPEGTSGKRYSSMVIREGGKASIFQPFSVE